jgi:hypothetical protein
MALSSSRGVLVAVCLARRPGPEGRLWPRGFCRPRRLARTGRAQSHGCRAEPIPGGIQPGGPGTTLFHVFPPDPSAPQLAEPSTITNFSGFLGLAVVRGSGTETNRKTRVRRTLSWEVDLRFFDGFIASGDGRELARCTFGFV